MFYIKVKKSNLIIKNKEPLAAGASKVYHVGFDFDSEWDGLLKNVIFRAGETSISVLLEGETCTIPWEVLSTENIGEKLWVGVYGSDIQGTKLPTVWNELEIIQAGAELCGSGSEPTPTAVSLIYETAKNAESMAKEAVKEASMAKAHAESAFLAKDAAEAAAEDAKDEVIKAQAEVKLAFDEAERAKNEANTAANHSTNARMAAEDAAESAQAAAKNATESAQAAAKNTAEIKNQCANALRGTLSGTAVSADDVSPIEHELDIKVIGENIEGVKVNRLGKNLFDISRVKTFTGGKVGVDDYGVTNNEDGTLTVYTHSSAIPPPLVGHTLRDFAPSLKVGETYTFNAKTTGAASIIYLGNNAQTVLRFGTSMEITEDMLSALVYWYADNTVGTYQIATISDIQIEQGTSATEYEPYKEPIEAIADAEGNVKGLMSLAPNMTLTTDNDGAVIECNYTKDTNKVIEQLTNAIISLGGNI